MRVLKIVERVIYFVDKHPGEKFSVEILSEMLGIPVQDIRNACKKLLLSGKIYAEGKTSQLYFSRLKNNDQNHCLPYFIKCKPYMPDKKMQHVIARCKELYPS